MIGSLLTLAAIALADHSTDHSDTQSASKTTNHAATHHAEEPSKTYATVFVKITKHQKQARVAAATPAVAGEPVNASNSNVGAGNATDNSTGTNSSTPISSVNAGAPTGFNYAAVGVAAGAVALML